MLEKLPVIGVSVSLELWPWLTVAGLGACHGLNPSMGWLFAVALGLHGVDRRIVWLALVPSLSFRGSVGLWAVGRCASVPASP